MAKQLNPLRYIKLPKIGLVQVKKLLGSISRYSIVTKLVEHFTICEVDIGVRDSINFL